MKTEANDILTNENLRKLSVAEVKEIQLEILSFFHEYCIRYGLRYYLSAGTLIGAVRHKGYIPWDDDIDVVMLREDYDRLLSQFNQTNTRYQIISNDLDYTCKYGYAKLVNSGTVFIEDPKYDLDKRIGINIDIFPLENLGNDYQQAIKTVKKAEKYTWIIDKKNCVLKHKTPLKTITLKLIKTVMKIFSYKWCFDGVRRIMNTRKNDNASIYVGQITLFAKGENEILKREWFSKQVDMEFEGRRFFAPIGYDEYLKRLFGDYMKLPPKEQQVTHHVFQAYKYIDNEG